MRSCALDLACALVLAFPALAAAQSSSAQLPRIGLIAWSDCATEEPWLLPGLGESGYRPGKTVTIECRNANKSYDGLAKAAAELVALEPDLIVGMSQPAGMAAQNATNTIPIVSIFSGDPVAIGLAKSIGEPGGNLTGLSYYATDLTAKRLALLKEAIPDLETVGVLANPDVSYLPFEDDAKQAAGPLGLETRIYPASKPADLGDTFLAMQADGAQAVFILPDMMLASEAQQIATLALERHLPTMAWGDWYTEVGSLMAYSARYSELIDRLAYYVDRILKGADPGDLPIEQPTMFQLSINLRTAAELDLELPTALLLRADHVIE